MASRLFGKGIQNILNGNIDLDTDTIKAALTTSAYAPNFDTDEFFSSVTNEIVGTGYVAGGVVTASPVVGVDATNHRVYLTLADLQWLSSIITNARYVVLYKSTGVAGTSRLIAVIDLGGNKSTDGDTFYVTIPNAANDGALYISY